MTDVPDLTPLPLDAPQPQGRPLVTCRLCDEPLTAAASRRWGYGPRCRRKLGLRTGPRQDGHEVPQDGLPGM